MQFLTRLFPLVLAGVTLGALADGPEDNKLENVRPVPPPGIAIAEPDRADLRRSADEFRQQLDLLADVLRGKPMAALLPDAEIFHKAVDWALRYDEFYATNQVEIARQLLEQGRERAMWLGRGVAPWTKATGLVVRGYRSKIDDSVQPYGLEVPDSFAVSPTDPHRLDFWFHGRGEKLTELDFINQRQSKAGEFTPPNTFVLHLYGRYCNANKFAGEVDLFEALDHARASYPVDDDRLVVRGFSMGGAACWQFAVHYADRWAAAAPGAGFSETPEFLKVFQNETLQPAPWEQKLWHWYNATDYALNLFHCPTVAYSGESDKQIQAAQAMEQAMSAEGLSLVHVVGAGMGHKYDEASKHEINRRIDAIVNRGRDLLPRSVRFTTFTLRYNRMHWVEVEGLEQHWERARVEADIVGDRQVKVRTTNVSHLKLALPAGHCPLDPSAIPQVEIDGQSLVGGPVMSDRSWAGRFRKMDGKWQSYQPGDDVAGRKRPGLQGPIDDVFMERFVIVRPTGRPLNDKVGAWVASELDHAVVHWRRQFRGELQVIDDVDVTPEVMRDQHLVLFGDPQSNNVLKQFYDVLPVMWMPDGIAAAGTVYDAAHHTLATIQLNPLNPRRYVVLNSGVTFREYDYLNNARQVAKLPDWAVIDVRQPVNARAPGKIAAAGFYDEKWALPAR